jgi:hypothetical protein
LQRLDSTDEPGGAADRNSLPHLHGVRQRHVTGGDDPVVLVKLVPVARFDHSARRKKMPVLSGVRTQRALAPHG